MPGGALSAINGSTVTVSASRFTACRASYGGGVAASWWSSLNVSGSTFIGGRALNGAEPGTIGNGGATLAAYFSSARVADSYMEGCRAARGGGASALFHSSLEIENVTALNNSALFDG